MLGVSLTITGSRVCRLHQAVTISTRSGTWPTAEPICRSDMPCGQPKLSSMPSQPVAMASSEVAPAGTVAETLSAARVTVPPLVRIGEVACPCAALLVGVSVTVAPVQPVAAPET